MTSRDAILEQAMIIAKAEGIEQVNIRKLAKACNMAIGSMYNYYPDKRSLMREVSLCFWKDVLTDHDKIYRKGMKFTEFLEIYYSFVYGRLKQYDRQWVNDFIGKPFEKEASQLLMGALKADHRVNPAIWNMELTKEGFVDHVMTNLVALLRAGEANCKFFVFLLEQLLYPN